MYFASSAVLGAATGTGLALVLAVTSMIWKINKFPSTISEKIVYINENLWQKYYNAAVYILQS